MTVEARSNIRQEFTSQFRDRSSINRFFSVTADPSDSHLTIFGLQGVGSPPNDIPGFGDVHPDQEAFFARDFTIVKEGGDSHLITVKVTYVPADFLTSPDDVGYTAIQSDVRGVQLPRWRTGITSNPPEGNVGFNSDGTPNGLEDEDIGGTMADVDGAPLTIIRGRAVIQIVLISDEPPVVNEALDQVGTRNSTAFLNADPGKLMFVDVKTSAIRCSVYRQVWDFVQDNEFHMVQIPGRNQYGRPHLTSILPPILTTIRHAEHVVWRQPFPQQNEFHNLNGTEFIDIEQWVYSECINPLNTPEIGEPDIGSEGPP